MKATLAIAALMASTSAIDISQTNSLKQSQTAELHSHLNAEQQTEMKAQIDEAIQEYLMQKNEASN